MSQEANTSQPMPALSTPYEALVSVLNRCSSDLSVPLSIEILLPSHPLPSGAFVAVEENTLFIPKSTLLKAFIVAREIFFSHDLASTSVTFPQEIVDATAVLLLFDPEHITAANARKKTLLTSGSGLASTQRVLVELWFTEGMLTSKMKRHNKSPTLWGHRRWLLKTIGDSRGTREISVVALVSAQNHPRNYYAWDFVRWWVESNPQVLVAFDADRERMLGTDRGRMPSIVAFYMDWALRHPNDTSGWSFLLWLLEFATAGGETEDLYARVMADVMWRAERFGLKNESLWTFLRALKATEGMPAELRHQYDKRTPFDLATQKLKTQPSLET